ncbi:MAG: hypothetical protein JWN74_2852 [Acidobacteriaceae bacterium]|nr:hypothetical protein [Acidobacteriaceae bacterium]
MSNGKVGGREENDLLVPGTGLEPARLYGTGS